MKNNRLLLLIVIVALFVSYFVFDLGRFLGLDYLKAQQAALRGQVDAMPVQSALVFFVIYVVATAASFPGAALLTLLAGALFGLVWGTVLVSFASTLGATLAFLATRWIFRDAVRARFGQRLAPIDAGVRQDGAFYLFTLRLVPVVPFFLINLLMGLTPIRTVTYAVVSQIGMFPGTIVYVNAGRELGQIESLSGIVSPSLILSFVLLGIFPWIARSALSWLRRRRVYARWPKPRRYDRNLIVIGAGSAGLVTAYIAAAVRARVTLVEQHRMGGDCLNYGCVPSKAIIRSARIARLIGRAGEFGLDVGAPHVDFGRVMRRVHEVIRTIEPHDSVERYTGLGVECLTGRARITSPWSVEIDGRTLTTRAIVIASGAAPHVPDLPGLAACGYHTSETVWSLERAPARLLVLGGGPIGCELAQAFARLGSAVTLVQRNARLLPREDDEVSQFVRASLESDGVNVLTDCRAQAVQPGADGHELLCLTQGAQQRIAFDVVLLALGRTPRVTGFGLEELGIGVTRAGTVETDDYLQTLYPNIYAAGDVAGPYQFTHVAAHQAWYASVNALFGRFRRFRADYSAIPACTFVDPEVARVGLNEREARERGIAYEVTRYGIDDLDRAIAEGVAHGFVKVLTVPGRDRILGATVVGEHAGELLAEFTLAMRARLGLNTILSTIHAYPTFVEANKYAAGAWKRAHVSQPVLGWLERYHAWERG